jgi:hypothetical protein
MAVLLLSIERVTSCWWQRGSTRRFVATAGLQAKRWHKLLPLCLSRKSGWLHGQDFRLRTFSISIFLSGSACFPCKIGIQGPQLALA